MPRSVMQQIKGMGVAGPDGPVAKVEDVYFDDHYWTVRYLQVDTAEMMPGHKALISPASVVPGSVEEHALRVDLTREQLDNGPGLEKDQPISRVLEEAHAKYYGYAGYWAGPFMWGQVLDPYGQMPPPEDPETLRQQQAAAKRAEASHLRSAAEVVGYGIRATDGDIGHVEDFVVDERDWSISAMIVDTRNWLPGKKVLVPPGAIEKIDWASRQVEVRMKRNELKQAPEAG